MFSVVLHKIAPKLVWLILPFLDSFMFFLWASCVVCFPSPCQGRLCLNIRSYYNSYHTIIQAMFVCVFVCSLFVCVFVCSLFPLRSCDGSSPNLVDVCRLTSHLPLRGSFSKRSTGQRVTFTFHYIIYAPASRRTAAKDPFCFAAAESNSAPFTALHLDGVCTWTSQLPLRGSFSKRSTGRRVNGSNGSTCQWLLSWKRQQVDGSMGQTGRRVNGSLSLSL